MWRVASLPNGWGRSKEKFVRGWGLQRPENPGGQVNSAKIVVRHLATLEQDY